MDQELKEMQTRPSGPREMFKIFRWVWRELLGQETKKRVPKLLLVSIAAGLCSMLWSWFLGRAVDRLAAGGDWIQVGSLLMFMVVSLIVFEFFRYREASIRELILGSTMGEVDDRMNQLFFEKSLGQHLREQEMLSAANVEKGRSRVWEATTTMLFDGIPTLFITLAAFLCLCYASLVTAAAMGVLFILQLLWASKLNTHVIRASIPIEGGFRDWNRYRSERWEHAERPKTCGKETEEQFTMNTWFQRLINQDRDVWLWFIKQQSLRNGLSLVFVLALTFYAFWQIRHGRWTLGLLMPITNWLYLLKDRIGHIGEIERKLNWCLTSIRSLRRALTLTPDVLDKPGAIKLVRNGPMTLEFRNVHHGYREKDGLYQPILRDVSFIVRAGSRVALLGRSGSGKSTLMRLSQRGMDPDQGTVLVNGIDLRDVERHSWLALAGYIPQQPIIFDGSVRSNLIYAMEETERAAATDDQLWSLMRDLQVDFGARLSQGLETTVGRSGIRLSGGEAQRLSIGSAVAKKPRFMLIDEATSALDSTTEKAVQEGLSKALEGDVSALIIAHRLSTVRQVCDTFVVLRCLKDVPEGESQVEAIGHSFEELYRISPTFRTLADDQGLVI